MTQQNPIFTFSDGSFKHLDKILGAHVDPGGYCKGLDLDYLPTLNVSNHPAIKHETLESANSELEALNGAVVAWHNRPRLSGAIALWEAWKLEQSR